MSKDTDSRRHAGRKEQDMSHTPEPWEYFEYTNSIGVKMIKGNKTKYSAEPYAVCGGYSQEDKDITRANARRIVACVNACAGMDEPEEQIKGMQFELARYNRILKSGINAVAIQNAMNYVLSVEQQRDELLEAINMALLAWGLDYLSHDPIDLLVEAIDKHKAQGVQSG
jgi:hypothetical protein